MIIMGDGFKKVPTELAAAIRPIQSLNSVNN